MADSKPIRAWLVRDVSGGNHQASYQLFPYGWKPRWVWFQLEPATYSHYAWCCDAGCHGISDGRAANRMSYGRYSKQKWEMLSSIRLNPHDDPLLIEIVTKVVETTDSPNGDAERYATD